MKVIETTLGTYERDDPPKRSWLARVLCAVFPMANPDFEGSYWRVRRWWVEIDGTGAPERELGFAEDGEAIVAAPVGSNFGYFTDSNMTFDPDEYREVPAETFEAAWSTFAARWSEQHAGKLDLDDPRT